LDSIDALLDVVEFVVHFCVQRHDLVPKSIKLLKNEVLDVLGMAVIATGLLFGVPTGLRNSVLDSGWPEAYPGILESRGASSSEC
jgi:hypothetical protein